jgi:ribosomal protein L27
VTVSDTGTARKKYNRRVEDTEIFAERVPDGDFIVTERPTRWLVRRVVGDGASQTTWAFQGGEAPAVAQALIFARHDGTAVWVRVGDHQFRLIQSFRP